jgi:hypothetical protein
MNRWFRHRYLGVVTVVVLCGLWLAVHGGGRHGGLIAVSIVVLRRLRRPCRSRTLITMIAIPLLLSEWLSLVVQSLRRVLGEMIGIVRLGRLSDLLALEAKVKGVDFVLYRSSLAQIWLRLGRL